MRGAGLALVSRRTWEQNRRGRTVRVAGEVQIGRPAAAASDCGAEMLLRVHCFTAATTGNGKGGAFRSVLLEVEAAIVSRGRDRGRESVALARRELIGMREFSSRVDVRYGLVGI